ncbi:hypothetical protein Pla163_23220 [Planctomycetes bacterium Pla163]|uniref:Uncharacterized protein n=2 Tax=Rohdeia mirabilis TaxID=2528008 RepID=A0A518D143_9BACT|nr:hypothetical protein Pla163_23220 [Planctomycetes bacterium Pla163]
MTSSTQPSGAEFPSTVLPRSEPDPGRADRLAGARASLHALGRLLRTAAGVTALCLVVSSTLGSCSGTRASRLGSPTKLAPAPAAVEAFREARAALRERATVTARDRDAARTVAEIDARIDAALERAASAAPDWVAPQRLLDDRARAQLDGPRALAERRARLRGADYGAADLYLAGRLEEAAGSVRFPMAVALDRSLSWPHHALSVDRELAGDLRAAVAHQARALDRANGGYEVALFARRLASLLRRTGRAGDGVTVLRGVLDDVRLGAIDRLEVSLDLVELELAFDRTEADRELGLRRALGLIASGLTGRSETANVVRRLSLSPKARSDAAFLTDLELALRRHPTYANDEELFDELRARGVHSVVVALERGLAPVDAAVPLPPTGDVWVDLERAFAAGRDATLAALDRLIDELPDQVLDADGALADPRLAALVATARATDFDAPLGRVELAEACLRCGWIGPASALARDVDRAAEPALVERARTVERRALAAEALLAELARLLESILGEETVFDIGAVPLADWDDLGPPKAVSSKLDLDELLARIGELVERYAAAIGWDDEDLGAAVAKSPVLRFGPFGAVLVPGPVFVARDEFLGVGAAGERVPGLADVLDRLGRMALLGQPPFGEVDGTVLRRLLATERSGEHLGMPWSGMVILCEGVDAVGRRSRSGLSISGAALHEGYWVDVGSQRSVLATWRGWQRLVTERGSDWARERLESFQLPLDLGAGGVERFERARLAPSLLAAEALRVAVLLERAQARPTDAPADADLVTLTELIQVVGNHEEGHLTDRTRFLPLTKNPLGIAAIAIGEGFSPLGLERRLEYRAQLVSLATVPDPRLPLVDLLEAAAVDARLETVHAHAYRRLLGDLLELWNERLERDPDAWPTVRRDCYLMYQVHRLAPSELHELALELARREGLVASGAD